MARSLSPLRFVLVALVALSLCASCASEASRTQQPPVTHQGAGVVVDVNVEKSRIKINHEEMPGYMKPMTMWFPVKDSKLIEGLKPNDRVTFTVAEEEAADVIVEIRKV